MKLSNRSDWNDIFGSKDYREKVSEDDQLKKKKNLLWAYTFLYTFLFIVSGGIVGIPTIWLAAGMDIFS